MATIVSNLDLIRRVPLFTALPETQAQFVAQAVQKKRYKRGEILVEQGKSSSTLYIILSGRVRVYATNGVGREVTLTRLSSGDYFGEMSLIDGGPHSAHVAADQQTDVLVLGQAAFRHCLMSSHALAEQVMRGLVSRLRQADGKIEMLALMDVYGRVAKALLEMGEEDEDERLLVLEKINRQDLAKQVGASREMVSRVMKDFSERGLIELLDSGALLVHDELRQRWAS